MAVTHCPSCGEYVSDRIAVCPKCENDMLAPHVDENGVTQTLKRESLDFPPILQKCMDYYEKEQGKNSLVVALRTISAILMVVLLPGVILGALLFVVYGFVPSKELGIASMVFILLEAVVATVIHALSLAKSPRIFVEKLRNWMLEEKLDSYEILDAIKLLPDNKMEEGLSKQNYHYALTAIAQAAILNIKKDDLVGKPNLHRKKTLAKLFGDLFSIFSACPWALGLSATKVLCKWLSAKRDKGTYPISMEEILEPFTVMPIFYVFTAVAIVLFIIQKAFFSKRKIAELETYRKLELSKWMNENYKTLRAKHYEQLGAENTATITK